MDNGATRRQRSLTGRPQSRILSEFTVFPYIGVCVCIYNVNRTLVGKCISKISVTPSCCRGFNGNSMWYLSACEGKGKGLDTCYSDTYMSQTRSHRFTILEVAADWHEPMVPQRITVAIHLPALTGQLDPRCS